MKDLIRQHNVKVFSSNYALYADMSQRVMSTLEEMAPAVEEYSIDESFMNITGSTIACRWTPSGALSGCGC